MNDQQTSAAPQHQDLRLRGTTAAVGLVLFAVSLFIITCDITHATDAVWLFRASAALGLLTLLSACLPSPSQEKTAVQEAPLRARPNSAV